MSCDFRMHSHAQGASLALLIAAEVMPAYLHAGNSDLMAFL